MNWGQASQTCGLYGTRQAGIRSPARSKQAKSALYATLVESLAEIGVSAQDIPIVLHEPPQENWGLSGQSGEQAHIGFDLNV